MPNPVGLNTTTLHMKFVEPDSTATPLQGSLTFTPNPSPLLFPLENVIVAGTETVTLDVNGEATIELISTDQAGENPTGWLYTVTERITGQKQRTYNIALPYNAGVTLELSDITPSTDAPTYIPVVGPQGPPGIITTINGYSAATVNLTAADVGAIPTTAFGTASGVATLTASSKHTASQYDGATVVLVSTRGAAGGVATLDGSTKIPVAQLPDLSATYVPISSADAALGYPALDGSAKVKSAALNLASSAPPSVGTGATGTSTNLARQDHTHDGVALTGNQTIAGNKTFSGTTAFTGTVASSGSVDSTRAGATNSSFTAQVTGDTVVRFNLRADGLHEWGTGAVARDTTLARSGVGELTANGNILLGAASPSATGHATRKDYVDNNFSSLTGAQTISGVKTFTGAPVMQQSSAATIAQNFKVAGDSNNRLTIGADGALSWGSGSAAADVVLSRTAGSSLSNSSNYQSQRSTAASTAFTALVGADAFDRLRLYADGKIEWGPGNVTRDTNLYRVSAGLLQTDQSLNVVGSLSAGNFPSGAWIPWTPVWSTTSGSALPSFGNATVNCSYTKHGRTVWFKMDITFGSTTNFGSGATTGDNWTMTLPVAAANTTDPVGVASYKLGSTSDATMGHMVLNSSTTVCQFYAGSGATDGAVVNGGIADSLSPRAWVSGSRLSVTGCYEAAS